MKGVFCLEGFWFGDHRDKTSVSPSLELLHRYQKLPFVHHRCGTKEEFIYSIERWKKKGFHKDYPLLSLAFHGEPGKIKIGRDEVNIQELGEILDDKCQGTAIYFGSCATMKWDKRFLQSFMTKTKTLAVMGYKEDVEWLPSTSFEIRLLSYFMNATYTTDGLKEVKETIQQECRGQCSELKFRFEMNERLRFTPKRVKVVVK